MSCKIIKLLLLILVTVSSGADIYPGARGMGMGGAYSSISDGVWGAWWNPAGIIRAGRPLLGTEYSNLYPNMELASIHYGAVSYLQPLSRFAAFAIGAEYLTTPELFSEGEANLTLAFRPGIFPISFGVTGRYLFRQYLSNEFTSYDPMFGEFGQQSKGIGVDVGLQAEIGRIATVSVVGRNLLQPEMGLEIEEKESMHFSLGTAFYPDFITPAIQFDYGLDEVYGNMDLDISVGIEKWLGNRDSWGLRGGYTMHDLGELHEVSAGFSARTEGSLPMELDYAVSIPLNDLTSTWGKHRIGVTFRLGGEAWDEVIPRVPLQPMVDEKTWNPACDMFEFQLWATRDITDDELYVVQEDALPLNSSISIDDTQTIFGYFPASATFTADDIKDLTAYFRVPRYWFEQNNLEVRLLRLWGVSESNTLERVPAALFDEDELYYYFESTLDNIGDFVITCRPADLVMLEPRTVYTPIDSVDILEASLSFRVSKLWMDENRIDPASIGLSRVPGGVPLDVNIWQIDEDLEYVYYETNPIDLFQFSIVGTEREGLPVSTIYFDYNIATIRDDQIPALNQVITTLRANPGVYVSIEGHADSDGTFSYNDGLSENRALNIVAYLTERLEGVDVDIEAVWFGERRPAASNDTLEGQELNRRVEIVILRGED